MNFNWKRFLFILACIFDGCGILSVIGSIIFYFIGNDSVFTILLIVAAALGSIGLILLITRAIIFGFSDSQNYYTYQTVKTVNVKPVKETEEEKLFKEYERLYNQGVISKEDLEKKRKELLN